jgi:hypothetical protein
MTLVIKICCVLIILLTSGCKRSNKPTQPQVDAISSVANTIPGTSVPLPTVPVIVDDPRVALRMVPLLPEASNIVTPSIKLLRITMSYVVTDQGDETENLLLKLLIQENWRLIVKVKDTTLVPKQTYELHQSCYLLENSRVKIRDYPFLIIDITNRRPSSGSTYIRATFEPQSASDQCAKVWFDNVKKPFSGSQ